MIKNKYVKNIDESYELLGTLIGKTEEEGRKICQENDYDFRLSRINKNIFCGTCDLKFDRINVDIDENIITKCWLG